MSKPSRNKAAFPLSETAFPVKHKTVPHEFVLDAMPPSSPRRG